ncbi:hypothetical protein AB0H60_08535 [Nocardia rhamnosiphila]
MRALKPARGRCAEPGGSGAATTRPTGVSVGLGSVWLVETGERIQELADRVVALRDAYYRGSPLVADAEYDAIEDELRGLIEAHPDLAPDPNPLEQVGAPAVLHAPIRHSRPMLSLEKATTPDQVQPGAERLGHRRDLWRPDGRDESGELADLHAGQLTDCVAPHGHGA